MTMCAIAGILDLPATSAVIEKMLVTMKRRGPDDNAVFRETTCSLLHSRLCVIDPEKGKQPMSLLWGQEIYTIVYNGELYNTCEIRDELKKRGHDFISHSDTEVILHAYAEYQEKALEKLNGIFAIAIWETNRKRLFMARDRMGVKPLFYTFQGKGMLFASEMKTLLAYPSIKPQIDATGISEILLLGPGRTPGCGVFKGVQELYPGTYAYWEDGSWENKPYWVLRDREHRETFPETVEHVRYLVSDAIKRQMVSDVPLGTFLSGGLDSSIITSVCACEAAKENNQLKTFSVDYINNDKYFIKGKYQPEADSHYIDIMQNALGTDHTQVILSSEDLINHLQAATEARDLPGMADVDFSLLAFCRYVRNSVTVALSGECADEIFGGYPWYRDPEIRDLEGFPWAQNLTQRIELLHPQFRNVIDGKSFVMDRYSDTIRKADILPGTSPLETRMKQMMNLNISWFMQTLLDRKDRMSMYHGLEVRVPFCDHRIAEYMYGVPWAYKEYQGREKGLLRLAMGSYLPEEIRTRKKSPYPKTYDPDYENRIKEMLMAVLADPTSPLLQIISAENLIGLLQKDSPWPWYGQLMRKPQTMAYFLQVNYWMKEYQIEIVG